MRHEANVSAQRLTRPAEIGPTLTYLFKRFELFALLADALNLPSSNSACCTGNSHVQDNVDEVTDRQGHR